jgi:2-haloacid dehalogenase
MANGVDAVAFDVNETMFSLDRLGPAFADVGLDPGLVGLWFTRLLRDGFALTAMGRYRPFAELAADALLGMAPDRIGDAEVRRVMASFRELPPQPDVAPALRLRQDAGVPAVTLTNGGADLVVGLLERAGLAGLVTRCLSVDAVRRWKPAGEPYRWAAAEVGVAEDRLGLVAAHPWDCAGAREAGLVAGWVNRTGARWPASFASPQVVGESLPEVVAGLLAVRGS